MIKRSFFGSGIRTKLFATTTVLIGVICVFIFFFFPAHLEEQAVRAVVAKASRIAEMTSFSIAPSIYFDDPLTTQEVFASTQQNPDLLYVIVIAPDGSPVASAPGYALTGALELPPEAQWNHISPDGSAYHATTAIRYRDTEIGTLHLALSLAAVQRQVASSRRMTALVSGTILLLGMLASFALSTTLTRPLTAVVAAAEVIANGDLTRRAEVAAEDEVGELARAFNTMVDNLEQAQRELEQLNQALEQRVSQRTAALREEIEERKRIEAALRASEDRLHTVVEHLPEGVLLLDGDGRVVLVNPAAEALSPTIGNVQPGRLLSSVAGIKIPDLTSAGDSGGWIEVVGRGEPRQVLEATARDLGGGDAGNGSILVLRNVTAERQVQEQLQQNERLAALGQLASGIAHDFRNILQGMMMSAELLLAQSGLPASDNEELSGILEQGRRGAAMIRQILDFSRRSISSRSRLDLGELLASNVPMLQRLIPETITIELRRPDGPLPVDGDATQIQQMLVNLVLNARDAMAAGGEVVITLERPVAGTAERAGVPQLPDVNWVVLRVSDRGCGISPGVRDHVFEPFFTTKATGSGTGLGLSQVYGIVAQHGGHVFFEDREGGGTEFTVLLRLAENGLLATASQAPVVCPVGAGQTILVVEDEAPLRRLLCRGLESLGYEVAEAANGHEALSLWQRQRSLIALVLSDVVMPGMGGIELLHRLKAADPAVRVVLVTGHPLAEKELAMISRHAVELVEKPLSLDALARAAASALEGRRSSEQE